MTVIGKRASRAIHGMPLNPSWDVVVLERRVRTIAIDRRILARRLFLRLSLLQ
jgi:hypothetical protein